MLDGFCLLDAGFHVGSLGRLKGFWNRQFIFVALSVVWNFRM